MKQIKELLELFDREPRVKYGVFFIIICAFVFATYTLITVLI